MPIKSTTPVATQTATDFRIGTFRADSRGQDWVAVLFESSNTENAPDEEKWVLYREITWTGATLAAVMADAASRIRAKLDAGTHPALAYRDGTREAMYARAQAEGVLPSGAGVTIQ